MTVKAPELDAIRGPTEVCPGETACFSASFSDCAGDVTWTGGGDPAGGEGEVFCTSWSEPGTYTVTASADGGNSVSLTVTVKQPQITGVFGPLEVCPGEEATFSVTMDECSGPVFWTGGGEPPGGYAETFATFWTTPGTYTVTATIGTSSQSTIVTVKQPQILGVTGPLEICVGEPATFSATLNECPGAVLWSGGGDPPSGFGADFTTTWHTPGTYTVVASIGTSSASTTITVKGATISPISGPMDYLCVDEEGTFSVTVTGCPSDVHWYVADGVPSNWTGPTFTTKFTSPGGRFVTATTSAGMQTAWVGVKGLLGIDGPTEPLEPGQTAVFTAVTDPPGFEYEVAWSTDADGTIWPGNAISWSTEGIHWVEATMCGQSQFYYVWVRTPDCIEGPAGIMPMASAATTPVVTIAVLGINGKAYFDDSPEGVAEFDCMATVSPSCYQNDIIWTLPEIAPTEADPNKKTTLEWQKGATWVPVTASDPPKGYHVTIRYRRLPAQNTDFGAKTVTAKAPGSNTATGTLKIFFSRDAKNHPGASVEPNWYYYWSQIPAVNYGIHTFDATQNRSYTKFIPDPADPTGKTGEWKCFICDGSQRASNAAYNYAEGIDRFAWTLRHEEQHRIQLNTLWGTNRPVRFDKNQYGYYNLANDSTPTTDGTGFEDHDIAQPGDPFNQPGDINIRGDNLPAKSVGGTLERDLGLPFHPVGDLYLLPRNPRGGYSPYYRVSTADDKGYGAGFTDVEDYDLHEQPTWTNNCRAIVEQDWSRDGKQWGHEPGSIVDCTTP